MPTTAKKSEPRWATYQDVLNAPAHQVAEILHGELFLFPRPAIAHAEAGSELGGQLRVRFGGRSGGPRAPGGWRILFEPELHFTDAMARLAVVVPDVAGWRLERMPVSPDVAFIELAPDWLCEVVSPGTARVDRMRKVPLYAEQGVPWVWLVDPQAETVEVLQLRDGAYSLVQTAEGNDKKAKLRPFDAVGFDLRRWWGR